MNSKILQPQHNSSLLKITIVISIVITIVIAHISAGIMYLSSQHYSGSQFSEQYLHLTTSIKRKTEDSKSKYRKVAITTKHPSSSKQNFISVNTIFESNTQLFKQAIQNNFNTSRMTAEENNTFILIISMFILFLIILVIMGWILKIRFNSSIANLTRTITDISIDNINQHIVNLNNTNNTEINQLLDAMKDMFIRINVSLSELKDKLSKNTLELQAHERIQEEHKNQTLKLSNQLKTLGFISRVILSTPNLDILLPRIATAIGETLSFYHIGIFLLDDAREYAILTATNSSGGQRMIERNHRLKVGEEGVVGYAAGSARPRIAYDTDKDSIFLINPDLPETHSELAMPLRVGVGVIGILDVQSKEPAAFSEEDIEFFSILGDYIGIAIQNAQRFQEIQKNITESDTLYRNYLRQEWKSFANQRRNLGYLYNISGSKPITKKLETTEIQKAVQSGKPTISQEKTQSHLSVPIKLRGQVIGVLNIQTGGNHDWEEDEVDIATAIADRVGLAVENARLLEDSQSRAARERTISEITSKIGASINIRNVLQTAVEELGHTLPGSDVIIQLKDTKNKE